MSQLLRRLLFKPQTFQATARLLSAGDTSIQDEDVNLRSPTSKTKTTLPHGPSLEDFIAQSITSNTNPLEPGNEATKSNRVPYLRDIDYTGHNRKVYFDVHGCQMNVSDTEVAWSVLQSNGYQRTTDIAKADVVLVMTCAIREGAEQKIWKKLKHLKMLKLRRAMLMKKDAPTMKIGILGCMAERLKATIIEKEKAVDLVCGPDAYRDLPRMLSTTAQGQTAVNVLLSLEETYADVVPVRLNEDSISAYVSIMRGCDNMCSYCIVPFTRGRERSRPIDTIIDEVKALSDQGVKQVTLLGQNVNSYRDVSESQHFGGYSGSTPTSLAPGFKTIYKTKVGGRRFSDLLDKVSQVDPDMRIRFTSPHPKDFPDEVLELIRDRHNISNQLHLPAQSGNDQVLSAMRRGYSVQAYRDLVIKVRQVLPGVCLTSDFIAGFCGETDQAHRDTVTLMRDVKYSMVYCFPYSMRQKTHAFHRLQDDVPEDVKKERFLELRQVFLEEAEKLNKATIGQEHLVLIEGKSPKSDAELAGRTDGGVKVILPDIEVPSGDSIRHLIPGDYVAVQIESGTSRSVRGRPLYHTTLKEYQSQPLSHLSDKSAD